MFNPFGSIISARNFSTSGTAFARAFKLVVTRQVAKRPTYKVGDTKPDYIPAQRAKFPDYKYGDSNNYKQSNFGLYGAKFRSSGHRISEFRNRVLRTFKPNVHRKKLWSEALNRDINVRVTAYVLRTISKEGGIDNYLVKDKSARIKELGPLGWKLRYLVLKKRHQLANPIHGNVETVELPSGETAKAYFPNIKSKTFEGQNVDLIIGKRKLFKLLVKQEQIQAKILGERITNKDCCNKYFGNTPQQLFTALEDLGFDPKPIVHVR